MKVYHLVRNGQPRDTPPTKLHVRLVGENGERVMVRVGGGWADLAEYLREYSLHHGTRANQDGKFEVANLPTSGVKKNDLLGSSPTGPSPNSMKPRPAVRPDAGFDFGTLPAMQPRKTRATSAPRLLDKGDFYVDPDAEAETPSRPPPVPVIPTTYRRESQVMSSANRSRGPSMSVSTTVTPTTPQIQKGNSTITTSPTVTTTSTFHSPTSTPASSPSYTPLGAAGPKGGINIAKTRATILGSPAVMSSPEQEAWVQGMVGKARQVSAGPTNASHVTTISGPGGISVTTSMGTPASRRVSAMAPTTPAAESPESTRNTQTPSPSPANKAGPESADVEKPRPKSRISSLGDVGGIRRVFLRSKREK